MLSRRLALTASRAFGTSTNVYPPSVELIKVAYTATAKATGGRNGTISTPGGEVNLKLVSPKEMGGSGAAGANPEQLFAGGYSACFLGALQVVAGKAGVALPAATSIDGAVSIGPIPAGFGIAAHLTIYVPGLPLEQAQELVAKAHQVCPYSNATRGNIKVTLTVNV